MKYIVILADGMADYACMPALDEKVVDQSHIASTRRSARMGANPAT